MSADRLSNPLLLFCIIKFIINKGTQIPRIKSGRDGTGFSYFIQIADALEASSLSYKVSQADELVFTAPDGEVGKSNCFSNRAKYKDIAKYS